MFFAIAQVEYKKHEFKRLYRTYRQLKDSNWNKPTDRDIFNKIYQSKLKPDHIEKIQKRIYNFKHKIVDKPVNDDLFDNEIEVVADGDEYVEF